MLSLSALVTCRHPSALGTGIMHGCCSFSAAHRAWGTIPDGTSAALVAVRCLSVWPLGRQYFLLMGLEQGACV